jgi:limonene-1,2-epoxide hydrolase
VFEVKNGKIVLWHQVDVPNLPSPSELA